MKYVFQTLWNLLSDSAPWWGSLLGAMALTLVLTPPVRALNRRLGMVDMPSARRINKTPVPRGGGLAIFIALLAVCALFPVLSGRQLFPGMDSAAIARLFCAPAILVALGYADDRFSLPPPVKLAGQIFAAAIAVFWCDMGFSSVFPGIPRWLDAAVTIFWIVGAINAFNLIDGLDGLASGLSLIATAGMAGALFCLGCKEMTYFHFILAGALLGFLRYNFHPASVFLGDCGSMLLGFLVATLPLVTRASNSFLVGIGVPLLAMGVPVFDTALAIMRRSIRSVLSRSAPHGSAGAQASGGKIMTADTDHLHHRILRRFASQRKAAFALFGLALFLVGIGIGGIVLKGGRAAALFITGFSVVAYIGFRDMRRVELWDAGRALDETVHSRAVSSRRRRYLLSVPFLIAVDICILIGAWVVASVFENLQVDARNIARWLTLRAIPLFLSLVFFRAYMTVWSRAMLSNYLRLAAAVATGSIATCAIVLVAEIPHSHLTSFTLLYSLLVFSGIVSVRMLRAAVRDFFYSLDAGKLAETDTVKRVVVYGCGLRYQAFRRELVRSAASSDRVIVGIIDDDILVRDQYVGGIRIYGTLEQAPSILKRLRADEVVVAARLAPERMTVARKMFSACGVKATLFSFEENPL